MAKQYYIVFGDDGHGMTTAGKRTPYIPSLKRYIHENEFNRAVIKYMKAMYADSEIIFIETAPGDADVPLNTRTGMANRIYREYCAKYGAANVHAVFLSVHYNALDGVFDGVGKDPEGVSTHVFPGSAKSKAYGKLLQAELIKGRVQKNRGVVDQVLAVTRDTIMPAALVECGFMDNLKEAIWMQEASFQQEVAGELFDGNAKYFAQFGYKAPSKPVAKPAAPKPKPVAPKPAPKPVVKPAPKPVVATGRFKDVPDAIAGFEAIEHLASIKVINGYPDGTYKPKEEITREHLAIVVSNAIKHLEGKK